MNGVLVVTWNAIAFAVQLLLCVKSRRLWIKWIPVLLQTAGILFCAVAYGLSGGSNWGWLILAVLQMQPFAAIGAAWLLYGIVCLLRRGKNK